MNIPKGRGTHGVNPAVLPIGVGQVEDREGEEIMTLVNIDLRFLESEYPLTAIGNLIEAVDQQMPSIIQQEVRRIEEKYRDETKNDPEKASDIFMLDTFVDEDFPRFFYGSMLVTLYGIFEAATMDAMQHIQGQKGHSKDIRDVPGDNYLSKVKKYFSTELEFVFEEESWNRLEMLRILRNALAHANGRLEFLKRRIRCRIENMAKQKIGVSISSGNIIISKDFLMESHVSVSKSVRALVAIVKEAYPLPKKNKENTHA